MATEPKQEGLIHEVEQGDDLAMTKERASAFTPQEEKALVRKLDFW